MVRRIGEWLTPNPHFFIIYSDIFVAYWLDDIPIVKMNMKYSALYIDNFCSI